MTDNQCHTKSVDVTPNVTNDRKRELWQAPHVEARRPCEPVLRWSTHERSTRASERAKPSRISPLGSVPQATSYPADHKGRTPNICTHAHMSIRAYDITHQTTAPPTSEGQGAHDEAGESDGAGVDQGADRDTSVVQQAPGMSRQSASLIDHCPENLRVGRGVLVSRKP